MYRGFTELSVLEFKNEAQKFLIDGFYNSPLGDIMPLAMANILSVDILVFTAQPHNPILFVSPSVPTASHGTIFIVYDFNGPGHYDAAVRCNKSIVPDKGTSSSIPDSKVIICKKCGVNGRKDKMQSCVPLEHYSTRCPCYKSSNPCTVLCCCKDCNNPHGCKIAYGSIMRKRRPHALQKQDVLSSKPFATGRMEKVSLGVWSEFESLILTEIMESSAIELACSEIMHIFNDIVQYSTSVACTLQLPDDTIFRNKSIRQITAKINCIRKA